MTRKSFNSFDGKEISYVEWEVDEPKALVLISHGMCEHILRYEYIAEQLNLAGYLVVGDDHRGHGQTDLNTLGYADGDMYNDTLKDMATLCKIYKEKYPEIKIILFSHSYGSFLAQRFIEEYNHFLNGAILGGSANMSGVLPVAGKMIASIGCAFKGKNKKANLLKKITFDSYNKQLKKDSFISTIENEVKRYNDDEFCGFTCSYNFYKSFFGGLCQVYKNKNLDKLNKDMPLLIISGANDPVGEFSKSTEKLFAMYKARGVKDVTLKLYDGALHEYLNDISKEQSKNDIIDFCNRICEAD